MDTSSCFEFQPHKKSLPAHIGYCGTGVLSTYCHRWESSPSSMHVSTKLYHKKFWTQWSGIVWEKYSLENFHPPQNLPVTVTAPRSSWDGLVEARRGDAEADECFSLCTKAVSTASTPTTVGETTWLKGQNFFLALGWCSFASETGDANTSTCIHVPLLLLWAVLSLPPFFPFPYSKAHAAGGMGTLGSTHPRQMAQPHHTQVCPLQRAPENKLVLHFFPTCRWRAGEYYTGTTFLPHSFHGQVPSPHTLFPVEERWEKSPGRTQPSSLLGVEHWVCIARRVPLVQQGKNKGSKRI